MSAGPNSWPPQVPHHAHFRAPTTPSGAAPGERHVWYPVQFHENSSFYFAAPEEMVLYASANSTENGTLGGAHAPLHDYDATVALVTMVVTAILLGLIILATVIGESLVTCRLSLVSDVVSGVAAYLKIFGNFG